MIMSMAERLSKEWIFGLEAKNLGVNCEIWEQSGSQGIVLCLCILDKHACHCYSLDGRFLVHIVIICSSCFKIELFICESARIRLLSCWINFTLKRKACFVWILLHVWSKESPTWGNTRTLSALKICHCYLLFQLGFFCQREFNMDSSKSIWKPSLTQVFILVIAGIHELKLSFCGILSHCFSAY